MAQYGVGTSNLFDALDEETPVKSAALKEGEEKQVTKQQKPTPAAAPAKADASRTLDAPTKRGARVPRGRGGRGRGLGNRAPKRVFERHSGTGRGKEVRKGGYGGYDAEGTMQDDIKAEEVTKELNAEDKPADQAAPAAEPQQPPAPETEEEKKAREEKEKEDALITYDQYLERQKKKAVEDDLKKQVRQVQIDDKKFKACKQLEKDGDNDYADILGSDKKEVSEDKKKGEKKVKKVKHLDEVLAELPGGNSVPSGNSDFRGRGRGGFRGGRGRGGRGGYRGGRGGAGQQEKVDIQDVTAFPKLGK